MKKIIITFAVLLVGTIVYASLEKYEIIPEQVLTKTATINSITIALDGSMVVEYSVGYKEKQEVTTYSLDMASCNESVAIVEMCKEMVSGTAGLVDTDKETLPSKEDYLQTRQQSIERP